MVLGPKTEQNLDIKVPVVNRTTISTYDNYGTYCFVRVSFSSGDGLGFKSQDCSILSAVSLRCRWYFSKSNCLAKYSNINDVKSRFSANWAMGALNVSATFDIRTIYVVPWLQNDLKRRIYAKVVTGNNARSTYSHRALSLGLGPAVAIFGTPISLFPNSGSITCLKTILLSSNSCQHGRERKVDNRLR